MSREQTYPHSPSSNKPIDVSIREAEPPDRQSISKPTQNHRGTKELRKTRKASEESCSWGEGWPCAQAPGSSPACSGAQAIATRHSLQPAWDLQTQSTWARGEKYQGRGREAQIGASQGSPQVEGRPLGRCRSGRVRQCVPRHPAELTQQLPENNRGESLGLRTGVKGGQVPRKGDQP